MPDSGGEEEKNAIFKEKKFIKVPFWPTFVFYDNQCPVTSYAESTHVQARRDFL